MIWRSIENKYKKKIKPSQKSGMLTTRERRREREGSLINILEYHYPYGCAKTSKALPAIELLIYNLGKVIEWPSIQIDAKIHTHTLFKREKQWCSYRKKMRSNLYLYVSTKIKRGKQFKGSTVFEKESKTHL